MLLQYFVPVHIRSNGAHSNSPVYPSILTFSLELVQFASFPFTLTTYVLVELSHLSTS